MRLHNFLIGLLMFGLFTTILVFVANDINTMSGTPAENEIMSKLGNLSEETEALYGTSRELRSKSLGGNGTNLGEATGSDTAETRAQASAWSAITSIPTTSFKIIDILMTDIQTELNLPQVFASVFIASIIILVAIIFLSSVLKNKL